MMLLGACEREVDTSKAEGNNPGPWTLNLKAAHVCEGEHEDATGFKISPSE
jgi:hypothetical protein